MRGRAADRAALEDMRRYATRAHSYTAGGRPSLDDPRTRDAVLYALAIVGEAANRVSRQLRDAHGDVPWRGIINQRNILVHVYDKLDLDLVWHAVELIPDLERNIRAILEELSE